MENRSLDLWLHAKKRSPGQFLDWPTRLKIAIGTAQGLCMEVVKEEVMAVHGCHVAGNIILLVDGRGTTWEERVAFFSGSAARPNGSKNFPPGYSLFSGSSSAFLWNSMYPITRTSIQINVVMENGSGNAGEPFDGQGAESGQHGPPAMDELTLSEPLKPEDFTVGLERRGLHVGSFGPCPDDVSGEVLSQILVQRVQLELQVLGGLSEPERVEAIVADEGAVEIFRRLGPRVPQGPVC
nr:receptor-like protein kinase HSL1 [Ipomoea batatas]